MHLICSRQGISGRYSLILIAPILFPVHLPLPVPYFIFFFLFPFKEYTNKFFFHGNGIKKIFSCSACVHQKDIQVVVRYFENAHLRIIARQVSARE